MTGVNCGICGGEPAAVHTAREMMFGTREAFRYGECGTCGTLSLADLPQDMASYYPDHYYSFGEEPSLSTTLRRRLRGFTTLHCPVGLVRRWSRLDCGEEVRRFRGRVRQGSSILDVGCGSGRLLQRLAAYGFRDLTGYDPYVESARRGAWRLSEQLPRRRYDLVMMHHALEHVPDVVSQLRVLRELTAPGGYVLVRVPLADSWAWRHYGVHWVQLDPPRHITVPTEAGFQRAASQAGLRVVSSYRDSTDFQIWGSEAYRRDIALMDARPSSAETSPTTRDFVDALNARRLGDQGVFWLAAT